jgi:hypothetical protein
VYPETTTDSLALLDERRVNLSHSRTRTINQLHALLRELLAGGAPTSLTPAGAATALRGFRPQTGSGWHWPKTSSPTSGGSTTNWPPTQRR